MAVSPQLSAKDIEQAAANGVTAIVNNRPRPEKDSASREQQTCAPPPTPQASAFHDIPMQGMAFTEDDVTALSAVLEEAEGKVVSFCRSGGRSAMLWAIAQAPHLGVDAVLAAAADAGFDLGGLRPLLEQRSA